MWNVAKGRRHWNYFDKCNRSMCDRTLLLLWGCWMHVPVWLCLKRAGLFGECSTKCHLEIWWLGGFAMHGHGKEALNILHRCVKKVYSQMISPLFVFCQLVAMQVLWMKACTVMIQWSQTIWFLQNWNITPVWLTFLVVLAVYKRQRIWSWQCPVHHMWMHGWLCLQNSW